MSGNPNQCAEPIALIGMGCRLPGGVGSPEAFWKLLCDGVDPITEVPESRWNLRSIFDSDRGRRGRSYTRSGGFIDGFDEFDASFFGISPREAACMDPQQRWLLEVAWEALEDAGLPPERLAGSDTGVFVGLFVRDYEQLQLSAVNREIIDAHTGVGVSMGIAANRISYAYNLLGPSLTVDTACSSAMVALHLACQSLRNRECGLAIVGGVNALLKPEFTIATSKASMLSPDGRSKSFDAGANGYVRSEGIGMVVLKPLAGALASDDPVYAVIRGSAINQDGRSNGLTVPNGASQEAALRAALRQAAVSPLQVQYAEAHGTGTPVGDPIEANALGNVLGRHRPAGERLVMGSVKSNIGHTESAAGIVGLIKVALALKHRQIPPNLHFRRPNPAIDFDALQLRVPTSLEPWPDAGAGPRMALINSFGFGGTNGSMVVEEAPAAAANPTPVPEGRAFLLPFSARSPEGLRAMAERLRDFCRQSDAALADVCSSAGARRGHLNHRAAVIADSKEAMAAELEAFLAGEKRLGTAAGEASETAPKVVFVFSGMGPQWWGMGRQLLAEEPVFREAVEKCDAIFRKLAGWPLLDEMTADEAHSRIHETRVAQPAIFAVQVGLAELWRAWGIVPDAVVGHSVGEAAAAYVSGALSLEDAVQVIYTRSRLQQTTAGTGTMLAAGLSRAEAEREIAPYSGEVSIGAINGPQSITLSGDAGVLGRIAASLTERGQFNRFLQVEVPYHSPKMEPIREEMLASLGSIQPRATSTPLFSTVTGARIEGEALTAAYWWSNVRNPVRFSDAMRSLAEWGGRVFIEAGPHPVLARNITECIADLGQAGVVLGSLRRGEPERAALLSTAGRLYCQGRPLNWKAIAPGSFVRLPAYAWQRERHWLETEASIEERIGHGMRRTGIAPLAAAHPLLGSRLNLAPSIRCWEAEIDLERLAFLKDHRIQSAVVFPGAAYVEMALVAADVNGVEGLEFRKALLPGEDPAQVQFTLTGDEFNIYSGRKGAWTLHATGRASNAEAACSTQDWRAIEGRLPKTLGQAEVYERFARLGLRYGPAFQGIERLSIGDGEAAGRLRSPAGLAGYRLHPCVLDACFQTLIGTVLEAHVAETKRGVYLPVRIGRIAVHAPIPPGTELLCYARLVARDTAGIGGDLELCDASGVLLVEVRGLGCKFEEVAREERPTDRYLYRHRWEAQAPAAAGTMAPAMWLILADRQGVAEKLAVQLREANQFPVLVHRGADLREALWSAMPAWRLADHVVHLESLDMPAAEQSLDQGPGCLGVLEILHAFEGRSPRLWLVTRGSQAVGTGRLNIAQAPLWGMARVIAQERPELRCARLDLDPAAPVNETSALFHELRANGPEDQVAWREGLREGSRHVLRLDRFEPASARKARPIRDDATYLVTGGMGGLGVEFSKHLLAEGARHLVLTVRRGSSGREETLADLRSGGAEVRAIAADMSAPGDVRRLLDEIRSAMPPLRGILHGAGIIEDGVLQQQTVERFERVWGPKARGAWTLHSETLDLPLDFFVCFSSVASLTGSAGQSNYAAANAFLDALAHHRRAMGLPALSINWGPWAQVGQAARGGILERLASRGMDALQPAEGLAAFSDLLEQPAAQVGVCAFHWGKFFQSFPGARSPFYAAIAAREAGAASAPAETGFRERLLAAPLREREGLLRQYLREELARALRFKSADQVKPRQRLFDLGLDSLTSVELSARLKADLGIPLPSTLLFDFPTVEALGDHLVRQVLAPLAAGGPVSEAPPSGQIHQDLSGLSQDEVADLLSRALAVGV
jgi:acyl transferase domain-containing protein/acyl carrier protein